MFITTGMNFAPLSNHNFAPLSSHNPYFIMEIKMLQIRNV